ncbi:TPA: hypothetical protein ACKQBZ_000150 [Stenotrophomonas maltophilia]
MTLRNAAISGLFLLIGAATATPASAGPMVSRFGPFTCRECLLQTPLPDAATLAYIHSSPAFTAMTHGNVITICSGSNCVSYTKTDGRNFEGGPIKPLEQGNPRGGGGGSGKSGGPYDGSSADGRDRKGGNARENERDGKDYVGRITVGKWTRK